MLGFCTLTHSLVRPLAHRYVGEVTTMDELFWNKHSFNEDIGGWVTSNVLTMRRMFYYAKAFNQPIGSWDISKVTSMLGTFEGAYKFNQDISNWDVSRVTDMYALFEHGWAFAQDLSPWCVKAIPEEPKYFGNGGGTDPVWGACPCITTNAANGNCEAITDKNIKKVVDYYYVIKEMSPKFMIQVIEEYGPMSRW